MQRLIACAFCSRHQASRVGLCVLCVNRMWGQSAGEQWQLLLSWLPQWILSLYALHLEDISHTRGKGTIMWRVNCKTLWNELHFVVHTDVVASSLIQALPAVHDLWPELSVIVLSWFLRSFSTSPPWICTGVICVGMTMWKSEMGTGGRHHLKVSFNSTTLYEGSNLLFYGAFFSWCIVGYLLLLTQIYCRPLQLFH